jgi:DNA-directed RNA polymerase specialized sigma54-like protein
MYRNEINEATEQELINEIISNSYEVEYEDIELQEALIEYLEADGYWIETIEEDILDSIYNGNWDEGANEG